MEQKGWVLEFYFYTFMTDWILKFRNLRVCFLAHGIECAQTCNAIFNWVKKQHSTGLHAQEEVTFSVRYDAKKENFL